jgi:hypothetical protein
MKSFFKDKHGRIVLFQVPNALVCAWIFFKVISLLLPGGRLKSGSAELGTAFLFVWAYFEITQGVNYFRRLLGLVVLVVIIVGFFR